MHELSVMQYVSRMTSSIAQEQHIPQVKLIVLQVGKMTGVEAKYAFQYWPEVIRGTALEGCELKIEEEDALVFCRECGTTFDPEPTNNRCPDCGERNFEIISGNHVLIKELGY